eukprot:174520_1
MAAESTQRESYCSLHYLKLTIPILLIVVIYLWIESNFALNHINISHIISAQAISYQHKPYISYNKSTTRLNIVSVVTGVYTQHETSHSPTILRNDTYGPCDAQSQCDLFVQYHNTPTASTFINGLFEHFFTHSLTIRHTTQVPKRLIEISRYPFNYTGDRNDKVYIDVNREGCGYKYGDPVPTDVTIIAYNYYSSKTYHERHQMKQIYLPLFFRYDTGHFERDMWPLINNYTFNTNTFEKRRYLLTVVLALSTGGRRKYAEAFKDIQKEIGNDTIYLHLINKWQAKNTDEYLNKDEYMQILLDTQFNACVDGNNPETFRIFETLATATIPIVAINTSEYLQHGCQNALDPFLLHGTATDSGDINIDKAFVTSHITFSRHNFRREWHYFHAQNGFDVKQLDQVYADNAFSPFIVLSEWDDLPLFLEYVNQYKDNPNAISFWNKWQQYLAIWCQQYLQFKQVQLADRIIEIFDYRID